MWVVASRVFSRQPLVGEMAVKAWRSGAASQLRQAFGLPWIVMAGCVPEVFGDGGGKGRGPRA